MQDPADDRRRPQRLHRDDIKRDWRRTLEPPIALQPGQAWLRLLCHVDTAGGVIGRSGTIIRRLQGETGAKINVENTIPRCHERVINVIGHAKVERKLTVEGNGGSAEEWEVSQVQEALFRVFERVLEVEGTKDGVIGCRLLSGAAHIGHLMGPGGSIVHRIRKNTGSMIRVLPRDQLPECASSSEQLIQIMGGILTVKKALLAVTFRLQGHPAMGGAPLHIASNSSGPDRHLEFPPRRVPLSPPLESSSANHDIVNSLSANVDGSLSLDDRKSVVFRLLCAAGKVGPIIGIGAAIVRTVEKESGASIRMTVPVAGCNECIAIISALENAKSTHSLTQLALSRVFAASVEADVDKGQLSALDKEGSVTARILVTSTEVGCLTDDAGKVSSDLGTISGVNIQILAGNLVPHCAEEGDKVVQMIGPYKNVNNALFQVTGRLRDNHFPCVVTSRSGATYHAYSAISHSRPCGKGYENRSRGLHHSADGFHLGQEMKEAMGNGKVLGITASERGLTSFGDQPEYGRTVEVAFPEHAFGSIFGENGSNLARLKQISGANVVVHKPHQTEQEGKVIISGLHYQTRVAESLLQAFILTA